MSTYSKYIGIPFVEKGRSTQGADCWGVVKLIYSHEKGIDDLPDFSGEYADTKDKLSIPLLIYEERQRWQKVDTPQEHDVVVFNIAGIPIHVGVMISQTHFIHATKNINCCIEKIDSLMWRNRVEGYYRYDQI